MQVYRLYEDEVELASALGGDLNEYVMGIGRPRAVRTLGRSSSQDRDDPNDILILLASSPCSSDETPYLGQRQRNDQAKNLVSFLVGDVRYAVEISSGTRDRESAAHRDAAPCAGRGRRRVRIIAATCCPWWTCACVSGCPAWRATRRTKWIIVRVPDRIGAGGAGGRRRDRGVRRGRGRPAQRARDRQRARRDAASPRCTPTMGGLVFVVDTAIVTSAARAARPQDLAAAPEETDMSIEKLSLGLADPGSRGADARRAGLAREEPIRRSGRCCCRRSAIPIGACARRPCTWRSRVRSELALIEPLVQAHLSGRQRGPAQRRARRARDPGRGRGARADRGAARMFRSTHASSWWKRSAKSGGPQWWSRAEPRPPSPKT